MSVEFQNWGEIEYAEAVERQLLLLEQVAAGELPDQVVFCTHPAVVTLGRSAKPADLMGWRGPVVESSRGGRATYHGPEQVVIYPILNLNREREAFAAKDVHAYLRFLETVLVQAMAGLGVQASERPKSFSPSDEKSDELLYTGVWVGENKLGSIGIAVKKWVTYHGAALNLVGSELAFSGISPCGFQQNTMTNLQAQLGQRPDREQVILALEHVFSEFLN